MKAAKKRAHGGDVESPKKGVVVGDKSPTEVYAGAGSNVVKEAKERKRGGSCGYESGGKAMAKKAAAKVEGKKAMDRLDRPKRATGGKIGANEKPFSTAATTTNRPGGDVQEA